jgi:hypothetical protein
MFNKNIIKKIIIITYLLLIFAAPAKIIFANTVLYNTTPKDSDMDGLTDQGEIQIFGTDPNNQDTDGDGYLDSAEIISGTNPLKANPLSEVSSQDIVIARTNSAGESTKLSWYIIRSSGLLSYILLFLIIISGIGIKTSLSYKIISPGNAWSLHKLFGISLTASIAVHLLSVLFDGFLQFSIADILIPFHSDFKSIYVGIGIIGFYIFLGIIITSLFYFTKMPKLWRFFHYLTYPTFVLLFLHGIYTGTDTALIWTQFMYWSTGLIVLILTSYRISLKIIK